MAGIQNCLRGKTFLALEGSATSQSSTKKLYSSSQTSESNKAGTWRTAMNHLKKKLYLSSQTSAVKHEASLSRTQAKAETQVHPLKLCQA